MSKKIIFIATSDVHWNEWSNSFNGVDRLKVIRKVMAEIYNIAHEQNAAILLPGDLVHNPSFISNRTLQELLLFYKLQKEIITYAIDGNHDQSEQNTITNRSPNYVTTIATVLPNFHNVADSHCIHKNIIVRGIPYITGNKGFKEYLKLVEKECKPDKKKILLIHTDLPRAKDSSGYQIDEVNGIPANVGKLFKKWDLVISGHIHMGQTVHSKIIMVGAPYQQRKSDENLLPGYWEIYDDLSFKFKEIKIAPVYTDDKPDDYHFFTKKIKKPKKRNNETDLKFDKSRTSEQLIDNYLHAIDETSKKRKKLLKTFLK